MMTISLAITYLTRKGSFVRVDVTCLMASSESLNRTTVDSYLIEEMGASGLSRHELIHRAVQTLLNKNSSFAGEISMAVLRGGLGGYKSSTITIVNSPESPISAINVHKYTDDNYSQLTFPNLHTHDITY